MKPGKVDNQLDQNIEPKNPRRRARELGCETAAAEILLPSVTVDRGRSEARIPDRLSLVYKVNVPAPLPPPFYRHTDVVEAFPRPATAR